MTACLKFTDLFKNNNWTFAQRISIKWYPLILLIVSVLSIILTILLQAYYNLVISKNSAVINIAHANMLKNEK